jgi:hypothetical protein
MFDCSDGNTLVAHLDNLPMMREAILEHLEHGSHLRIKADALRSADLPRFFTPPSKKVWSGLRESKSERRVFLTC